MKKKIHPVRFEAVEVRTDTGICIGLAETKKGEIHIMTGRTPESEGMCANAFCALSNAAFLMMFTDSMQGENNGYIDRVCPHGVVTFRLSRNQ